jgi:hypothetical protein
MKSQLFAGEAHHVYPFLTKRPEFKFAQVINHPKLLKGRFLGCHRGYKNPTISHKFPGVQLFITIPKKIWICGPVNHVLWGNKKPTIRHNMNRLLSVVVYDYVIYDYEYSPFDQGDPFKPINQWKVKDIHDSGVIYLGLSWIGQKWGSLKSQGLSQDFRYWNCLFGV